MSDENGPTGSRRGNARRIALASVVVTALLFGMLRPTI